MAQSNCNAGEDIGQVQYFPDFEKEVAWDKSSESHQNWAETVNRRRLVSLDSATSNGLAKLPFVIDGTARDE